MTYEQSREKDATLQLGTNIEAHMLLTPNAQEPFNHRLVQRLTKADAPWKYAEAVLSELGVNCDLSDEAMNHAHVLTTAQLGMLGTMVAEAYAGQQELLIRDQGNGDNQQ